MGQANISGEESGGSPRCTSVTYGWLDALPSLSSPVLLRSSSSPYNQSPLCNLQVPYLHLALSGLYYVLPFSLLLSLIYLSSPVRASLPFSFYLSPPPSAWPPPAAHSPLLTQPGPDEEWDHPREGGGTCSCSPQARPSDVASGKKIQLCKVNEWGRTQDDGQRQALNAAV